MYSKGAIPWNKGIRLSEELCKKISAGKTGVRFQQQHKDKIAETQKKRWEVIKEKQCSACSIRSRWIYKVHIPAVSEHELLLCDTDLIEQFHSLNAEDKKRVVIHS